MAQEVIFAEQTIEGFAYAAEYGAYHLGITPLPYTFVEGREYTVVWDGTGFVRTAFAYTASDGSECVAVGNPLVAGGEDNGDVFGIACDTTNNLLHYFSTETLTKHTVAIYQEVESEGTSIVLKDRNGNDVTYEGIKTVTFDTPTEGVQATFTLGVEQTGKVVELDLADGNQTVKADDGYLLKELTIKKPETLVPENIRNGENVGGVQGTFIGDTEEATVELSMADGDQVIEPSADGKVLSKVTITKPETLVPENIAEGIDIAGIIGTLASSGAGGNIKIATGKLTSSSAGSVTITHNLGVVPDFVFFHVPYGNISTQYAVRCGFGVSSAFNIAYPDSTIYNTYVLWTGSATSYGYYSSNPTIDGSSGFIREANETTFRLYGHSQQVLYSGSFWIAIGGLT